MSFAESFNTGFNQSYQSGAQNMSNSIWRGMQQAESNMKTNIALQQMQFDQAMKLADLDLKSKEMNLNERKAMSELALKDQQIKNAQFDLGLKNKVLSDQEEEKRILNNIGFVLSGTTDPNKMNEAVNSYLSSNDAYGKVNMSNVNALIESYKSPIIKQDAYVREQALMNSVISSGGNPNDFAYQDNLGAITYNQSAMAEFVQQKQLELVREKSKAEYKGKAEGLEGSGINPATGKPYKSEANEYLKSQYRMLDEQVKQGKMSPEDASDKKIQIASGRPLTFKKEETDTDNLDALISKRDKLIESQDKTKGWFGGVKDKASYNAYQRQIDLLNKQIESFGSSDTQNNASEKTDESSSIISEERSRAEMAEVDSRIKLLNEKESLTDEEKRDLDTLLQYKASLKKTDKPKASLTERVKLTLHPPAGVM